ncbi:hypothetical protein B0T14DRAFT_434869 [Immersiella caudata]|uniref:Uncharacterized protein n=1 Tax=Immersiella caudata TaxID=314043 RepID=A0AA39WJA7_9PEZI|nr:hypothetical protein B0T14DRAFT_434869 [Immersiella caudata]
MLPPTEIERQDIVGEIFGSPLASQANTTRFETYFRHYCSVVCPASSGDTVIQLDSPALRTHADILSSLKLLTHDPTITFEAFSNQAVNRRSSEATPKEREHVARVVVEVAFAINCSLKDYYSLNFADGGFRHVKWERNVPFSHFVESSFQLRPAHAQPSDYRGRLADMMKRKKALKAWKLKKRYGLKIRGTNNLLEHLAFDSKTKTLRVFHQVSFLRGHLAKTKDDSLDLTFHESLKRGTLPPRLLVETLLTFHDILFPVASVSDKKSRTTLEAMIQKHDFDAEGRWIEFIRPTPADMEFEYWGDRLLALANLVKEPPPANAVVAWFERHTSERNALTVAILGLFLSALFGFLSVLVGLLQLILAWVAYRNPLVSS